MAIQKTIKDTVDISAGDFQIDWGGGNIEKVICTDVESTTYSHTYDNAGEYTIGIGGSGITQSLCSVEEGG